MAAVLVFLFVIGTYSAMEGYRLRKGLEITPTPPRGESGGFLLFGSQCINRSDISEIYVRVDHLNLDRNEAAVNIYASFSAWSSFDDTLMFGGQVPYNFTDLDISVVMLRHTPTGGESVAAPTCGNSRFRVCSWGRAPVGNLSYFYALVDRTVETGGQFSDFIFEANFLWHNSTRRNSFTDFSLVVQFTFGFEADIQDLTGSHVFPLLTSEAKISRLTLSLPRDSLARTVNPTADIHTFRNDTLWYLWDVQKRSVMPLLGATAFAVEFEMTNLIEQKEKQLFDSALYLGVGIPTALSSVTSLATWLISSSYNGARNRSRSNKPAPIL